MATQGIQQYLEEKNINAVVGTAITEAAKARAETACEHMAGTLLDQGTINVPGLSDALRSLGDVHGDKVDYLVKKLKAANKKTKQKVPAGEIEFCYFPVVGRGEQVRLICAEHGITLKEIAPVGFGGDTFKHGETPNGHFPWMKDGKLVLNDSNVIVQYLIEKYPGPLTPTTFDEKMKALAAWSWCQDYYSFVLSPLHDMALKHNEKHWRNARLTDPRAVGDLEAEYVEDLKKLHQTRVGYFEKQVAALKSPFLAGAECTYADVFLYTCVYAVQKCAGFGPLRDACGGDPYSDCPSIVALVAKVAAREKIAAAAGKFDEAPI